jgi:YebC/PmpR family DNA-binding regulatory protein
MSGHSKWANIKHRKGRQDAKRGKVFTRLAKEITIAAREGGGDVDANPRLRLAVMSARAVNMPSDNIQRAIKRGTGEIEGITYEELTYEGYAPAGVAVICEVVTDNKNRTVAELRSQFGKLGGTLGESNSVMWNFDRKGVVTVKTAGISEDTMLEHILDSGADDMEYDEESTRILSAMENFGLVNKYCEEKKFERTEAKLEYIAKSVVKVESIIDARKVLKFIETMEEHEDIQNIYANFEIDDEMMEKIEAEG